MVDATARRNWWVAPVLLVVGPVVGAVLGVFSNAVNGGVCPRYFRLLLGWDGSDREVWVLSLLQGAFEGGILGAVFGVIVSVSFAASTRMRGGVGLALYSLCVAAVVAVASWLLGGVCGVVLALAFPEWYVQTFPVAWFVRDQPAHVAWVGGSIWGGYAGALLGAVAGCVVQHRRWARTRERGSGGFEPVLRSM